MQWWCAAQGVPWSWTWRPYPGVWLFIAALAIGWWAWTRRTGRTRRQVAFFLEVARDIERICPNAWLIQSSNPVFEGCTLIARETGINFVGLCHGHYGYEKVARVIGLDLEHVSALTPGSSTPTQLGSIQLADFINPGGLQAIGQNLFLETASSGSPSTGTPGLNGLGSVVQGALETSNVNVVEELVNMIETQRAYEMNSKAIQTTDRMLQFVTSNL